MTTGKRIKLLREQNNKMTQEELAKHINSTKQTIYKYENGIITNIPSDKIESIAKALNTTPAYLMGWDDLDKSLSESEEEVKFGNALELIGCYIEYVSWLIPPKNHDIDENEYYTLTYNDISFNITMGEYNELVRDIKSYLRFKVLNLIENKREKETPEYLLPNAAHEIEGASEEDKAHDDDIMDNDDLWR